MGACFTRSRAVTTGAPRARGLLGEPWPPVPHSNGAGQTERRVFSLRTKARYMDAAIRYARWARAEGGIVRLDRALRPELVRAWMYQRLAEGVSAATLKQEVCGIGKAARIAGRGTSAAWTALVHELPRRTLPPSHAYGPDGDRLVEHVALRSPEAGLALRFIQETGARIGSVVRTGEPGEHRLLVEQLHVDGQPGMVRALLDRQRLSSLCSRASATPVRCRRPSGP